MRSCQGKVAFETRERAVKVLKRWLLEPDEDGMTIQAYRCRHCRGWHLGSQPRKAKPYAKEVVDWREELE